MASSSRLFQEGSLRSLSLCWTFVLSAAFISTSLSATATMELISSQAGDTTLSDTLIYVDSSQPRLRAGLVGGPGVSTALLRSLPLDPSLAPSFSLGVRSEMEFGSPLYFLFEVEVSNRQLYTESTTATGGGILAHEFSFWYLQFPLLFQVHIPFFASAELTAGFGAAPAALISSSQRLSNGVSDTTLAIERGLEQFDFSLDFRFGSEWALGERTALTVDLRYLFGMQNLLILAPGDDPRRWKARSLGLRVGWMYQIQRPIYRE